VGAATAVEARATPVVSRLSRGWADWRLWKRFLLFGCILGPSFSMIRCMFEKRKRKANQVYTSFCNSQRGPSLASRYLCQLCRRLGRTVIGYAPFGLESRTKGKEDKRTKVLTPLKYHIDPVSWWVKDVQTRKLTQYRKACCSSKACL
jgi:hypothetical protein